MGIIYQTKKIVVKMIISEITFGDACLYLLVIRMFIIPTWFIGRREFSIYLTENYACNIHLIL